MPAAYSPSTWKSILACGTAVEAALERHDVHLTMGGEPTFVPVSPDGAEWKTAALGPTKLAYARRLARALVRTAFPGAVVLETSGKHYPGEPLPRWTLLVQRLADGRPLWRDITRLRADTKAGQHTAEQTKTFIRSLAEALSLPKARPLPLAEISSPAVIVGHVLPLDHDDTHWITDDWSPVYGTSPLELFAGESAAGLRLPLGQLGEKNLRRALTAESRDGTLTIFVPPLLLPATSICWRTSR